MLVGIDLGTTNSLVAAFIDGKPTLIPNRLGETLTPSVVAVDEEGTVLVGRSAKEYGLTHPLSVASVFKRSMGTEKTYSLGGMTMRPEELSSLVLRSLKEDAEVFLGCDVAQAIISVPAYFNEFQRKATKQAGALAGLDVVRIINEPTAAAMAYGVGSEDKDERCLVFDLGGGTFDVSILDFYHNVMEVHAVAGDNFLGGENFTQVLANQFLERNAIAPEQLDTRTMNRVMKAAEECKIAFGDDIAPLMSVTIDGKLIETPMPITDFRDACEPLLDRLRKPIERSLRDARMKLADIDRVVLVGGGTKLKLVRNFVTQTFRHFPDTTLVDPDTAVALGAALQCGMKLRDREIKEVVLTDVCPFTLGTEVCMDNGQFEESGHYLPLIERNTVIPVSRKQTVYTAHDNQTRVNVRILQGESRMAANNILLGEVKVPVPAGPKGKEGIDITYTYDVNSLLEVEVRVLSTGITRKVVVQDGEHRLSDDEVNQRFERLQYLKQSPRDEEPNKLVLLRGERLYEESTGDTRNALNRALMDFEQVLAKQDRLEIERARKTLADFLDAIEFDL